MSKENETKVPLGTIEEDVHNADADWMLKGMCEALCRGTLSATTHHEITLLHGMSDVYPIVKDVPGVLNCLRHHKQEAWKEVTAVGIGTSGAIMLTLMKIVYPGITPVLLTKPKESTHRSKKVFVPHAPIVVVDDQVLTYATMRTIAKSLGRVRSYDVIGVVAYGAHHDRILKIFPNVKIIIQ